MPRKTYNFDGNNEGWRVYDDTNGTVGGGTLHNSFFGGAQIADNETGSSPWFATPSDFSGDNTDLIGGNLSFSFRNADAQPFTPDAPVSSIQIKLVANDGTELNAQVNITPTTGLVNQNVSFDLNAATFGVSDADFAAVMGDLSFTAINADVRSTQENTIIDNVVFDAPADGVVDGEATGESMGVGYDDEDGDTDGGGDVIGAGDDSIRGNGGDDTIDGGGGNDTIDGGADSDSIEGGAGDDSLTGGADASADTLSGGTGDDTLEGGGGADSLTGGDGADSLIGGDGDDVINTFVGGQSGFETGGDSVGTGNADYVDAGDGDDTIIGGFGSGETIEGGAGDDTFSLLSMGTASATNLDLEAGTYTLGTGGSGSLSNVENVVGTFGNDTIKGDDQDNTLSGGFDGFGDDDIAGGGGDDTITGGRGNDTLSGDDGASTPQVELLSNGDFNGGLSGWTVNNPTGGHAPVGFQGDILFNAGNEGSFGDGIQQSFNSVAGQEHTVDLELGERFGGVGDHTFRVDVLDADGNVVETQEYTATDGSTINPSFTFIATSPTSTLVITNTSSTNTNGTDGVVKNVSVTTDDVTDAGNDSLDGGSGEDVIDGQAGDDTLVGGSGDDTLTGGAGEDVFQFSAGAGADRITDFDLRDDDGSGRSNDQFDVSDLTGPNGDPLKASDVTVSADSDGNAVLTFPGGDSVILVGIAPGDVSGKQQLARMGIPCFTKGTRLRTKRGEILVEDLQVGDLVMTKDNGYQPIRWIGVRHLDQSLLNVLPHLKPVLFPKGIFGNYCDLLVSPQHGMLLDCDNGLAEEQFARARHIAEAQGPVRVARGKKEVTYYHVLFSSHQVVFANGAATESFYPGSQSLNMFRSHELKELEALVPGLQEEGAEVAYGPLARPFVAKKDLIAMFAAQRETSLT